MDKVTCCFTCPKDTACATTTGFPALNSSEPEPWKQRYLRHFTDSDWLLSCSQGGSSNADWLCADVLTFFKWKPDTSGLSKKVLWAHFLYVELSSFFQHKVQLRAFEIRFVCLKSRIFGEVTSGKRVSSRRLRRRSQKNSGRPNLPIKFWHGGYQK